MTGSRADDAGGIAGLIESGSREELARALAPVVAGMLQRRTASRADAISALPAAMKAVFSLRRRLKGGAVRAGVLRIFREKAFGSCAEGAPAGLESAPGGAAAAEALLADEGRGLEELVLVAVEGLSCREAGLVTGDPPAVVEQRAAAAFARAAGAVASGEAPPPGPGASPDGTPAGCADIREMLLARELGTLDPGEVAEVDGHAGACAACRALVDAAGETLGLLREWRAATDAPPDEAEVEALVSALAAMESARSERATARRSAREPSPPKRGSAAVVVLGTLAFIGVAAAAWFITRPRPALRKDPLRDVAPMITDGARARDAACVIDVMLLDEWKYAQPGETRIASLAWARTIARREGLASRCAFVRALLGAEAGSMTDGASAGADPLRFAGELELAGLHAAAASECTRVAAAARTDDERRRAKLHLSSALVMQGTVGRALALLDEIAPQPPAPAEGEAAPPESPPRDFIARLADILRARAIGAAEMRKALAEYKRPNERFADDRGGKLAVDALELDRAVELMVGEDVSNTSPLVRGWVLLLRGEVEESEPDLSLVAERGRRYHRALANLALAEGAFRQGRFRSARYYLDQSGKAAVEAYDQSFFNIVTLRSVTHALVDFGRPAFVTSDLENVPAEGAPRAIVDAVMVPRVQPLIDARDAITKDWETQKTIFDAALGPAKPGEVIARPAVPKLDFDSGVSGLEPATDESEIDEADGLSGKGARVSSTSGSPAARLVFEEPVPEVETWVAFAVKLESPGVLAIWAKDAASGALFRFRTASLGPGKWHRLAVPLGALEPETPAGGDESLLTKSVRSVGFSMVAAPDEGAAFVLDDVLVHHGLVPQDADDRPKPPGP